MTDRQADILQTIVEYYVQTASPVGSQSLADHFGVSSATIRAEMSALESMGYISHPHTSAGRVPTDAGYRYYVEMLVKPRRRLDSTSRLRTAINRAIAGAGSPQSAIKVAADSLARVTQNVAFATIGPAVYIRGFSQLFSRPEFADNAADIAWMLDNFETWLLETVPGDEVSAYIGEENSIGKSSGCSVIVAGFGSSLGRRGYIGVVGPTRQRYGSVMHLVGSAANKLEESL